MFPQRILGFAVVFLRENSRSEKIDKILRLFVLFVDLFVVQIVRLAYQDGLYNPFIFSDY